MTRLWLALVLTAALATPAFAGDAECSYIEIVATTGKEPSIDPELKPLEKKLRKPPFTAWNTFRKLSSGAFVLVKLKAEALRLKQAGVSVMLRDRTPKRIELTVAMDNAAGKRVLDAKPAFNAKDWLMLGSPATNGTDDGHILALTCK